jgi:hypothetical protein
MKHSPKNIYIPLRDIYSANMSTKEFIKKTYGAKALTYQEQYLNEDGTKRDSPKDMENKYIMYCDYGEDPRDIGHLVLIPDSLYCDKWPDKKGKK